MKGVLYLIASICMFGSAIFSEKSRSAYHGAAIALSVAATINLWMHATEKRPGK